MPEVTRLITRLEYGRCWFKKLKEEEVIQLTTRCSSDLAGFGMKIFWDFPLLFNVFSIS